MIIFCQEILILMSKLSNKTHDIHEPIIEQQCPTQGFARYRVVFGDAIIHAAHQAWGLFGIKMMK